MKKVFIIFPIHLFKWEQLPLGIDCDYFLLEEPIYFGYREKKMNFNKIKLVLHRSSMKYYEDYLTRKNANVKYFNFKQLKNKKLSLYVKGYDEIHFFHPNDHLLMNNIYKIKNKTIQVHPTPNFLTPLEDLEKYAEGKKKFFHHNFYEWQKKRMNILSGIKSYDTENREGYPRKNELTVPKLSPNFNLNNKYVKEAKKYVDNNFGENYGNVNDFIYPITHKTSELWFKYFLKNKFDKFGKYQDAIGIDEPFMFHSVITPMLNIGLLDPQWIIDECQKYYSQNKISINNYEGYIRQIIGWREYSRMLYLFKYKEMKNSNYFNNVKKLTTKWYTGQTGIKPIDDTIIIAFKYGYLHHILRLMMMSNFMNLCQIHPDEVYKWFMEFSADSYDWVMINNVYSMGLYADGGLTMRKPYLSSDNYIIKMSNYKKDGYWDEIWSTLYYYFLFTKYNKLEKTMMARNLGIWNNKSNDEKLKIKQNAKKYLKILVDF